ncbi:ATP-binding cassette domain-containing protein [Roseobacter sp. YSTF-M11]|uniref:ATP-binding cassette domain-containing protein n=1 Tax=Roseobacter insulae TaxID=2859783 RepID=A0A9X1FWX5_9RHOB|nr:ATP-binding cassette domain-containing protein [Roseobacter insulae]MBW4709221.1 ATP-binding cassette domain-containing protein [Roseobacter insulae]
MKGNPGSPDAAKVTPAREAIIRVRGLHTAFGPQVVHDNLNLDVWKGEVLGIVGGSGTGKSVLLRTIVGLIRPVRGEIQVLGTDVINGPESDRRAVEKQWGVAFQDGALFSSLTVLQNVMAPMREHLRLSHGLMKALGELKISLVGLPPLSCGKFPSELSGGMRKRAALARALALDPKIVFLDEPTAGLDPIGAAAYDDLIGELQRSLGLTVFMVTHDLDSLYAICDRVAVLAEKRVLVEGPVDMMATVDHPWVQEYFTGPRARAATAAD